MKLYDSNGRRLDDYQIVPGGKSDTYIESATYFDDGSDVPEAELDWIARNYCLCLSCRESA